MNNIYITSDTHYCHENIVRGTSKWEDKSRCRDFDTLEEHDETLIKNINKVVKKNDYLYCLGDWSFGGKEQISEFRNRLECQSVILILGNHDLHIVKNSYVPYRKWEVRAQDLFKSTHEILEKKWMKHNFVMCHYPILSWHRKAAGAIHLYGHTHEELNYHPHAICVSIECHPEFRPFSIEELIKIKEERDIEHTSSTI